MSDTPRTDAETMRDEYDHVDTEFGAFAPSNTVSADFARQLERELAEVTKQRDELYDALDMAAEYIYEALVDYDSVYNRHRATKQGRKAISDDLEKVRSLLEKLQENDER